MRILDGMGDLMFKIMFYDLSPMMTACEESAQNSCLIPQYKKLPETPSSGIIPVKCAIITTFEIHLYCILL